MNGFVNWADFLHADTDEIIFSYTDIILSIFNF